MKSIQEMINVMQAFERGERIEFQQYGRKWLEDKTWHDVQYPAWDWLHADYRIKPKFKFIPFESVEEFLEAQKVHGVILKNSIDMGFESSIDCHGCVTLVNIISESVFEETFQTIFEKFTFQDGTPCGKVSED